jgi:hypothetical protein
MSRIHEALKKAEQDRAATQGGGAVQPKLGHGAGDRSADLQRLQQADPR